MEVLVQLEEDDPSVRDAAVSSDRDAGRVDGWIWDTIEPMPGLDPTIAARLRRNDKGLVAAIVQQHDTGEVLMLAWMDDDALHRTLTTRTATFWSRSRQELWMKGATSGNTQRVIEVRLDCDGDAVLVKVDPDGPACHTGAHSCFDDDQLPVDGAVS